MCFCLATKSILHLNGLCVTFQDRDKEEKREQGDSLDDVSKGPVERLDLVLDAMFLTHGLHQWSDLVQVMPGHGGKQTATPKWDQC